MPIYTYQCDNCGVRFDRQQSFSERQLSQCPECKKKTLHRVYLPVGVVFRGSGFYVTDNRGSSSTSRVGSSNEKPKDTDSESKSESKSETKSETKDSTKE